MFQETTPSTVTVTSSDASDLVGRLVKICGIISKPQLNGRLATCIGKINGRYKCILASSSCIPDDDDQESQAVEIDQWQTKIYNLKGSNIIDQATINMANLKAQAQEQQKNILVESSASIDVSRAEIMNCSPEKLVELIELSVLSHGHCMICAERFLDLASNHEVEGEVIYQLMTQNNGHAAKIIIHCLLNSFLLNTHTDHIADLLADSAILQCVNGMSNGFASVANSTINIPMMISKIQKGELSMKETAKQWKANKDVKVKASGLKFRESLPGLAVNTMLSESGFLETMAQRLDDLQLSTDLERISSVTYISLITTVCLGNDGKNSQGCQGEAGEGNARRNAASAAGCIESIVRLVRRIATGELPVTATATDQLQCDAAGEKYEPSMNMSMLLSQLFKCLDRILCGHDAEAINRCYRVAALGFVPFAVQAFSRFYSEEAMGWALTCCNTLGRHDKTINFQWEKAMSETSDSFQQMIQEKVEAKMMEEKMAMEAQMAMLSGDGCPTQ